MNIAPEFAAPALPTARIGKTIASIPHTIGNGFTAQHFSEEMFDGCMDPLLMVDHFVMTAPTFEPHLHAGISAVTAMFEDSVGDFINRDTLGQNVALKAGDLYWLSAASGAAHEEKPADGARIHALQIFVNLPARLKQEPARALHVRAREMPILEGQGFRVRLLLGRSGDVVGAEDTPEEMTMLDGYLETGSSFPHTLPLRRQAWVYAVSGALTVHCGDEMRELPTGTATSIKAGPESKILLRAAGLSHFVLMAAKPVGETFVKYGPLVMSSAADVQRTLADYASGRFGRISN